MRKYLSFGVLCVGLLTSAVAQKPKVILFPELYELLNKQNDTTYVVNFWATWCKPCVHELPDFEEFNKLSLNKKIKVVLVSLDFVKDYESKLIPFVKKHNLNATVVLLNEPDYNSWIDRVAPEWGGAIPATIIVNNKEHFRKFFEQDLTFDDLQRTTKSLIKE